MAKRLGMLALYGYFVVFVVITVGLGYYWNRKNAAPPQPIEFPHTIHVKKVGLKCENCHQYADKSIHAGIPPVSLCMECHKAVATDKPRIQKLTQEYWDKKKPVEWSQIHKVRDFVHFSHKRHIKKGFKCETCHGQVQEMTQVFKTKSLLMGWCVTCHKENGGPVDCYACHK